jgi:hypothetical protein
VRDRSYQDGAFWGIGFPPVVPSPYQSTIYMVKKDLKSRRFTVLGAGLERLDIAMVLFSFEVEVDGESIEHKKCLD